MLPPSLRHPGARCARCERTGWRFDVAPVVPCDCVQTCPLCQGSGVVGAGVTRCACWVARERVAALNRAGLPAAGGAPSGECAAWFSAYRPEDGWPWLLACGTPDAEVASGLASLILSVGVPVVTVQPGGPLPLIRVLAAFGLQRWSAAQAEQLTAHCEAGGLTLVATADAEPFAGLKVGDAAALALWENGTVVSAG